MAISAADGPSNLTLRIISASTLGPVVLAMAYAGEVYFLILIGIIVYILGLEWVSICTEKVFGFNSGVICAGLVGSVVLIGFEQVNIAFYSIALTAFALAVFAGLATQSAWLACGVVFIGVSFATLILMRLDAGLNSNYIFWLLAVVWSSDTGAYIFGRLIGGAKLAPKISPKKTWAGFYGGLICSATAGGAVAIIADGASILVLSIFSAIVGFMAQIGDLLESWLKRKFSVKDSGDIIPGHGGLLDRVDGLMTASLFCTVVWWVEKDWIAKWL
jgi:phosphatidate cytidylyltransferase